MVTSVCELCTSPTSASPTSTSATSTTRGTRSIASRGLSCSTSRPWWRLCTNQPAEKSTTIEAPDLIAYLHLDMAMDREEVVAMGDLELLTGTEMNIERSPGTVGDLLAE